MNHGAPGTVVLVNCTVVDGRVVDGMAPLTDAAVWALESAFEGFTAVGNTADRAEAAGELIELLRASGQSDRADQVTAQLTR